MSNAVMTAFGLHITAVNVCTIRARPLTSPSKQSSWTTVSLSRAKRTTSSVMARHRCNLCTPVINYEHSPSSTKTVQYWLLTLLTTAADARHRPKVAHCCADTERVVQMLA
jgi:hypothetical protein